MKARRPFRPAAESSQPRRTKAPCDGPSPRSVGLVCRLGLRLERDNGGAHDLTPSISASASANLPGSRIIELAIAIEEPLLSCSKADVLGPKSDPGGKICRVIFDKMQGGPTHCIAESHCVVRSWKNFSLSKEQGEASGIAGKSGGTAGCKGGRMQGSRNSARS
jgi:hypothetical protein